MSVHKGRHRLQSGPWTERRAGAADLRACSGAATLAEAEPALERLADRWATTAPALSPRWLAAWDRLTVCFDSPPAIRRALSTPKAMESLDASLRKVFQGRSAFPQDEAILNGLSLGLHHGATQWTQPMPEWPTALQQLVILFGERVQG